MRVQLARVSKRYGAQVVLEQVDLTIGPHARVGIVGPNGVGKTTLLRIVAGREDPDVGSVVRAPTWLTCGYLAQKRLGGEQRPLLETLARRTGVAQAEQELLASSVALARADDASDAERYSVALDAFLALGGGDFEARARTVCAELGLSADLGRPAHALSGGERARAALAAILLSRYDLLLLDEPTNDLDYDGLERLERFLGSYAGALVVVSHDRELLDRTVTRIVEIQPESHRVREWAGGWSDFAAARETERAAASARHEQALVRQAEGRGAPREAAYGGARARRLARQGDGWRRSSRHPGPADEGAASGAAARAGGAPGEAVRALEAPADARRGAPARATSSRDSMSAVAVRGAFRLGPVSLDLVPGERLSVTGRNGSGKSTLLGMLLGEIPPHRGRTAPGPANADRDARPAPRRVRRRRAPARGAFARARGSRPSRRGRCSRSSASAPTMSVAPARRSRRVSGRGSSSRSSSRCR